MLSFVDVKVKNCLFFSLLLRISGAFLLLPFHQQIVNKNPKLLGSFQEITASDFSVKLTRNTPFSTRVK